MGCDYYIVKVLRIYYNDTEYLSLEIDRKYEYYYYSTMYDEDDVNYEDKVNNYIKHELTPTMEPLIIYNNGAFNKSINPKFIGEYSNMIPQKKSFLTYKIFF
jgi:hypothetical protein